MRVVRFVLSKAKKYFPLKLKLYLYAKKVMNMTMNTTKTAISLKNSCLFDLRLSSVSVKVPKLSMMLSFALSTLSSTLCAISECSFTMTANLLKMVPNSTMFDSTAVMASARSRR